MDYKEYIEKELDCEIYDLTSYTNEDDYIIVEFSIKPPKPMDYIKIDWDVDPIIIED